MGKRSRKRLDPDRPASTRAERDARRAAAPAVQRRATRERPPAPWGSFPLSELVIFIGLVMFIVGMITAGSHRGRTLALAGLVLGSLGGLEVSVREHFAGFKSHSALLAGGVAIAAMTITVIAGSITTIVLGVAVLIGTIVFFLAFWGFREAFKRRSGGLGFR